MCGIVGMVMKGNNGLIKKNEDSFFEMLYADAVRGYDSTGVIGIEKDGSFTIAKEAVEATWVIPQIKGDPFCQGMYNRGKAWIGHNRKKTVGAIKDETAHPFVVDKTFAMVHNGTLYNHKQLADVEVDSQALTIVLQQALTQKEYIPALEETLGKVFGAYAVAMYNQKGDAVHLLRNKERPLCIVEADDAYYFASEPMMALWILCRNGYAYDKLKVKAVPEHTLITFDLLKDKVYEETLVPKKSFVPMTTTTSSGAGATSRYGTGFVPATPQLGDKVTKGNIKFFRRRWLNQRISFWAGDWIEENYPRTIERDGETEVMLMGFHDDIKEMHDISATVDLKKCGIEAADITDVRWTGMVTEILHNVDTERAVLMVTQVKPVITSKGMANIDDKKADFRKGLQGKSWVMLKRELDEFKNDLVTWQRDLYHEVIAKKEDEISKISHTMGMNAAIDAYAKKGITLEQQLRQGKCVLVVPTTQEVVYESPVSLH